MARDPSGELARITERMLESIREARKTASVQVAKVLVQIEEHLLDPKVHIQDVRQWAKIRDKNVSTRFAEELGLPPREFMVERRMEIAMWGLEKTDLKIWQIAIGCGYSSGQVLGAAFKRWSGQTATEYRRAARASTGEPETLAAPAALVDSEEVRRKLAGDPEAGRGLAVATGFDALQGELCANYRLLDPPTPYSEPTRARGLWQYMALSTSEERMRTVETHAAEFETPALFNRLCTEAIAVGERDDVLGLELATLAIRSLDAILPRLDKPLGLSFFARAYAVAGNAYRRSGKREDAAEAFAVALRAVEAAGPGGHPLVAAEIFMYLCCLEIERENFGFAADYLRMGRELWQKFVAKLEQAAAAPEEPQAPAGE